MSLSHASTLLQVPTAAQISDNQISLVDRSQSLSTPFGPPSATDQSDNEQSAPRSNSEGPRLYQRLTDNSLSLPDNVRREIVKQRYAKYGQDRYDACTPGGESSAETPGAMPPAGASIDAQLTYFTRAQTRAKAYWNRKRTLGQGRDKADTIVDVLYENQRGSFFFGIPKYSSNSLLPSDPKAWQNAQFRTSAVDIRNAQVPDPSWEWVWKSWYVDMSRDVDEEGWEYSFAFVGRGSTTFAWHGNHPWFHSFVRRRRWLRMRKRRDLDLHHTRVKAHEMSADYFTIHAKTLRPESIFSSLARSGGMNNQALRQKEHAPDISQMDISTIGDLFFALRVASVDREKLLAVHKFVDESGDELPYLGRHIAEVMSTFVFQSSRRLLLKALEARQEEFENELGGNATNTQDNSDKLAKEDHEQEAQRSKMLLDVVKAAQKQIRLLEYWSDVKSADSPSGPNDNSFESKQAAEEGAPKLHEHPEHSNQGNGSGSENTSKRSSVWLNAEPARRESSEVVKLERFITAPESPADIARKEKERGKLDESRSHGHADQLPDAVARPLDEEGD